MGEGDRITMLQTTPFGIAVLARDSNREIARLERLRSDATRLSVLEFASSPEMSLTAYFHPRDPDVWWLVGFNLSTDDSYDAGQPSWTLRHAAVEPDNTVAFLSTALIETRERTLLVWAPRFAGNDLWDSWPERLVTFAWDQPNKPAWNPGRVVPPPLGVDVECTAIVEGVECDRNWPCRWQTGSRAAADMSCRFPEGFAALRATGGRRRRHLVLRHRSRRPLLAAQSAFVRADGHRHVSGLDGGLRRRSAFS